MTRYLTALAALCTACPMQAVLAQNFPTKPVRFIVSFAAGGSTDTVARVLATSLSERWRQQVIVDNRGGGGTVIATEITSRALPDGHTFLIVDPSFAINPSFLGKLPYDPLKDFEPVTAVALVPLMLAVNPAVPAKSVAELIALARAKPGALTYASSGMGGSSQMAAEILKAMTGIKMVHVPYKGGAPAAIDLIAGQVTMTFQGIPALIPHVQAGKLRALAVTSEKRSAAVPDIPTIAETGLPGYEVISWQGIFTPAGVPRQIVSKLQTDLIEVANLPNVKSRFAAVGAEPGSSTPQQFAAYLKSQIATYAKVIRDADIRPE